MHNQVHGCCPGCGGRTLVLYDHGHITCSLLGCPDPTAADRLLDVGEIEHLVEFGPDGFKVIHPLRERLTDDPFDMFDCALDQWCRDLSGPPVKPGRYRAVADDNGGWQFSEVTV